MKIKLFKNNIMLYLYFIVFTIYLNGQQIYLNEIVSSNGTSLYDEDGDTPDWIEIHNSSNESIDLMDFGLTDDSGDLFKWTFPSLLMNPNDYAVIFASNKNKLEIINTWDAILEIGDTWSYWVGNNQPILNWEHPETEIASWPTGQSGFGFGDDDDNTDIGQTVSVFVRSNFNIEDLSTLSKVLFHLDYDDGYIAYLNGVEFSRQNLGAPGTNISYNATTTALHEAEIYSGSFPEEIIINPDEYPFYQGQNTLAIEVHNYSNTSSDLSCIPFLTFGYNIEVEDIRVPNANMELPNTFLHTNFKISSSGENIILSNNLAQILDSVFTGELETDMSYGRIIESQQWGLFQTPTPGVPNSTNSFWGILSPPSFSEESGFYSDNQVSITIDQLNELSTTHYTMDGSQPTLTSLEYQNPIILNDNSVIRARSFQENWATSKTTSKTYIFRDEAPGELPVFFLTTDPSSFFDNDTGIYTLGSNASTDFPYFGSNFWEDWERPVHFEIVDPNRLGYSADAGVKIFGGWSRAFPQKSLSFFARSYFGPSSFNYSFFPDSQIDQYEAFVLRNSGNDWESTVLRDGFTTSLTKSLNIDHQQYRPAVLYINGQFWGIQNIREKINEHYISSNHNIDTEHIDLLVTQGIYEDEIVHGTNTDYLNLLNYIEFNDMNDLTVENALENWIDIESFLSYHTFQIFIDNRDWPGNNIKFWKDNRNGGKWRWILYDTDFGFGIWDGNAFTFNTLNFALEENGPGWPNPPWSTLLLRRIISNNNFKNQFITVYCDMLNTIFRPEYLVSHLDSISSLIEDVIPKHRSRWYNNGSWPNSALNWEDRLNNIENYSQNRHGYALDHLQNRFDLGNISQSTLRINPENSGYIDFNSLKIEVPIWNGSYFPNIPVTAKAIPLEGFEFSHWEEFPDSGETINLSTSPQSLSAIFIESQLTSENIIINEINYNSNDAINSGDWVELMNIDSSEKDISGWELKDDDNEHSFILPEGSIISGNGFLLIVEDVNLFATVHPDYINVFGSFNFGLGGGGDQIRIYNNFGVLVDSLEYDDSDPWPVEPDGNGNTLELINHEYDNSLAESWSSSHDLYGSPGYQNSSYLINDKITQIVPNQISLGVPFPNPFNGIVKIPIVITHNYSERLLIFNITGELINEISLNHLSVGSHTINWNGLDKKGVNVSTGIYFISLQNIKINNVQKILYLK